MDGGAFGPTHETPASGLLSWDAPDPSRAAAHRLEPGLAVEVIETATGWAHVRCSNGWETWVDGAELVALPFRPTHAVPPAGLDAREEPDARRLPVARLDAGLAVAVIEASSGWARVRCDNGWEAWVDGRALVPVAAQAPTTRADSLAPGGALTAIGIPAVVVLLGSFLPWLSAGGEDANAWDIEIVALFTHRDSSLGLKAGPVLLALSLVAFVGFACFLAGPAPRAVTIAVGVAGVLVFGIGALGVILYVDLPEPRPGLGVGMLLTMASGVALAVGGFLAPFRAAPPRTPLR